MYAVIHALGFGIGWVLLSSVLFLVVLTWPFMRYVFGVLALLLSFTGNAMAVAGLGSVAVLGHIALYYFRGK